MSEGRPPETPRKQLPTKEPSTSFIAVGLIHAARGINGELRVVRLTDIEGRFEAGSTLYVEGFAHTVVRSRTDRHGLLLILEGVERRSDAEGLKGRLLEVRETDSPALEENSYYRHQLIGLRVREIGGNELGRIEEILETGANDVFVVRDASGETLIPAVDSMVKRVDLAAGEMLVELMAGLEQRSLKRTARGKPIQVHNKRDR